MNICGVEPCAHLLNIPTSAAEAAASIPHVTSSAVSGASGSPGASIWHLPERLLSPIVLDGPLSVLLALGSESELGWQVSALLHAKVTDWRAAALCQPPLDGVQLLVDFSFHCHYSMLSSLGQGRSS